MANRPKVLVGGRAARDSGAAISKTSTSLTASDLLVSGPKVARDVGGIRVLIVADIRLYREGLAQVLDGREGWHVVGTAADRREALVKIKELGPQIVLLDMATPESHATAREIERASLEVRVVALAVAEVEGDVLACAEAGVAGYVRREGSLEDLVEAVERAARGEVHCSPQLAGSLWRRLARLAANQQQAPTADLTRREREIVRLIEQDLSNKEIARHLGIEVATVKNHVHNLLEKIGVHRRTEAARLLTRTFPFCEVPMARV